MVSTKSPVANRARRSNRSGRLRQWPNVAVPYRSQPSFAPFGVCSSLVLWARSGNHGRYSFDPYRDGLHLPEGTLPVTWKRIINQVEKEEDYEKKDHFFCPAFGRPDRQSSHIYRRRQPQSV